MKLRHFALSAMALAGAFAANSQQVAISPVPHSVEWGAKAFDLSSASCYLTGSSDAATTALLMSITGVKEGGNVEICVGKAGDSAVASVADKIPAKAEGYYLSVAPGKVIIAGRDDAGTYYGAQTLLQIMSQPEVMSVTVTDYPMTELRGVIEGFYGNPWSFDDRKSQFEFYGANKMNIYIYGPKDDPYHHSQWSTPYPEAEAARMAELVKYAADHKVKFVWAMHPSNSIASDADKKKALAKFEQMYGLGVRAFAIFFDDISAESVNNQVTYLNYLTDEFVNKKGDVEQMIVCPTQYNRAWSGGTYLSTMGNGLYPGIKIMWTGNSVVDMIQKADCDWFKSQTGRAPFIWLNYPVNDYGQHNLLMGPVKDNGTDIYDQVTAFCSNPMQYAEASKVALYSLADFAWNPTDYDADQAWERSMAYLMPEHTEAFRTFCLTNVDVAPSAHGLRLYGETPEFKALNDKYSELTPEAISAYAAYFAATKAAGEELLSLEDNALVSEIKEFIQYFDYQALRGQKAMEMAKALDDKTPDTFVDAYKAYKDATEQAGRLMSRKFDGSIQSVAPRTGTLYVEPFIKASVSQLVADFKKAGYEYDKDLFPAQLLDNGLYYIKVNGKYLTNVNGSSNPTLVASVDEVNPGRQYWIISLEPGTNRYSIKNEWDKRYVNELGNFGTNPYEDVWHTYTITRLDGKYAIQNGGSAGTAYWATSNDRINKGTKSDYHIDNFTFEIVPVDGDSEVDHPTLIGKTVLFFNEDGKALTTKGKGVVARFEDAKYPVNGGQIFTATIDNTTGAVKFTNVATKEHLDEVGRVGSSTGYSATWNTFAVSECGGLYSISYISESKNYYGLKYWVPGVETIEYSSDIELADSYLFKILTKEDYEEKAGINEVGQTPDTAAGRTFDLTGREINPAADPAPGIYIVNGKKQIIR